MTDPVDRAAGGGRQPGRRRPVLVVAVLLALVAAGVVGAVLADRVPGATDRGPQLAASPGAAATPTGADVAGLPSCPEGEVINVVPSDGVVADGTWDAGADDWAGKFLQSSYAQSQHPQALQSLPAPQWRADGRKPSANSALIWAGDGDGGTAFLVVVRARKDGTWNAVAATPAGCRPATG